MYADIFASHQDRLAPAGVVPTHTPRRKRSRNWSSCVQTGTEGRDDRRHRAASHKEQGRSPRQCGSTRLHLDSAYDYDPLWAKFVEVGIVPTTHNISLMALCQSTSTLCLQSRRSFCRRRGSLRQGAISAAGISIASNPEIFIFGRRLWLGGKPLQRHLRALKPRNIKALNRFLKPQAHRLERNPLWPNAMVITIIASIG